MRSLLVAHPHENKVRGGLMKRVKSGIREFDKMVYGGIPQGSVVMVAGTAGSGKSIFSLQTLCQGARGGEKGLYITFEQEPDDIIEQGREFDWNIDALLKKGSLRIMRMGYPKIQDNGSKAFEKVLEEWRLPKAMSDEIMDEIREFGPKRVVIDSLSTLGSGMRSNIADMMKRDIIKEMIMALKKENLALTIVTSELPRTGDWYSNDGASEFLVDGIVVLHKLSTGMGTSRMISIEKMRKTNHSIAKMPLSIEDGAGIVIRAGE